MSTDITKMNHLDYLPTLSDIQKFEFSCKNRYLTILLRMKKESDRVFSVIVKVQIVRLGLKRILILKR